jgi:hypothetical protein
MWSAMNSKEKNNDIKVIQEIIDMEQKIMEALERNNQNP